VTDSLQGFLNLLNANPDEGIHSILTLFNLLPDPAILYQPDSDAIVVANNAFYLMTNLGEDEFIQHSIKTILPNITDTDPISGHNKPALLRHKKQPLIPVIVRIFPLNNLEKYLILLLKPEESQLISKSLVDEQSKTIEGLLSLVQTQNEPSIDVTLEQILNQSSALLDAQVVCIYKATGSTPLLVQHITNDKRMAADFPQEVSNRDLVHHQEPELWTPDKPILSIFHRKASDANFQFLVMIPLVLDTAKFGLFIAGAKTPKSHTHTLSLAKLIAAYISGQWQHQNTLQNLRRLTNKIRQVVKIQNEIITNLDEGVIILAPDLTIAELNPAAETILGYANVETLRQPIETILIGSESLGSALKSAQQGIPTLTSGDLTLHHRSGRSFPAQVMMSPVMRDGQLLSIIILMRDVSQQEQSQATSKQLEQRAILGEVTAIFAHEVRNPINAIMLSLQVMEDNLGQQDPNHKWIENMRDECNKLMYLMDSVLSFAKPLEYKIAGLDLNFLLSRILERWHPMFMRLNISPYFESELDQPVIEGDLRALEQVFTNLISNSVNAMSEKGGSLGIKITEADNAEDRGFIQVTLTDTGHGIPDEIKAHMFKPFVTGSSRGTGLGLAITQRIINAHKGKIEVDSYPGGTIFRIFLLKRKGSNNR
jgi:two-component system, NtrC family, sensor histidine kinase AtoS